MKGYLPTILLLVVLPAIARGNDAEDAFKEWVNLKGDLAETLSPIKDRKSAETALPKLKVLDERFAVLTKMGTPAFPKLSTEERKLFERKYQEPIARAAKLDGEVDRIEKLAEVKALLTKETGCVKAIYEFREQLEKAKALAAQLAVREIEQALLRFRLANDDWPKNLKALTQGDNAILKPESLTDPWGKPYQYNQAGPKNEGKKPDVWSVTPDKKVIGNWKQEKK